MSGSDQNFRRDKDPRPLADHLNTAMRRINMGDTGAVGGLFGQWRTIVGDQIADNVTPVRLENKRLIVEVLEPAWATQFSFLEAQVLHTLREHLGDVVEAIDVRVSRSRRRGKSTS
jgi:predicted nucleic acid-binding Zn ribbon protein